MFFSIIISKSSELSVLFYFFYQNTGTFYVPTLAENNYQHGQDKQAFIGMVMLWRSFDIHIRLRSHFKQGVKICPGTHVGKCKTVCRCYVKVLDLHWLFLKRNSQSYTVLLLNTSSLFGIQLICPTPRLFCYRLPNLQRREVGKENDFNLQLKM